MKLYVFGMRGNVFFNWTESYLANVLQFVSHNNEKSKPKYITLGVPTVPFSLFLYL